MGNLLGFWGTRKASVTADRQRYPETADHLVVFSHGLDGHPDDLAYISAQLEQKHPERIVTFLATSYDNKTHDGLDNAGMSVAQEVEEFTAMLRERGVNVRLISFVGHSLGGLVSRYAIGLLYDRGFFDHVKPMNFTTFATPHLGARKVLGGYNLETLAGHAFNWLAPAVKRSRSAAQLFLEDDFAGRPLLVAMTDPDMPYIPALRLFQHRSLYANVRLDYLVPYYTASISAVNFHMKRCSHISGYAPVIFNLNSPATEDTSARRSEAPKELDFQNNQGSMLEALNGLQWSKYPVDVNSWSAHTAILVFKVWNERSCQGKIVVQHYIDKFVVSDDVA